MIQEIQGRMFLIMSALLTCILALTLQDWGAIAAIILALATIGGWLYLFGLNKKPFNIKYSIIARKIEPPDNAHLMNGDFGQDFISWSQSNKEMELLENSTYTINIQMKPRKSCDIASVEYRFIEEGGEQPQVLRLSDTNPQAFYIQAFHAQRAKGILLAYSNELHSNRGGKAIDYWCIFNTNNKWQGHLSLRLSIVGIDSRNIRIPVKVT